MKNIYTINDISCFWWSSTLEPVSKLALRDKIGLTVKEVSPCHSDPLVANKPGFYHPP